MFLQQFLLFHTLLTTWIRGYTPSDNWYNCYNMVYMMKVKSKMNEMLQNLIIGSLDIHNI